MWFRGHLKSYFDSFFKKWSNNSTYFHNFCNLRGTKNILENMLWYEVCLIQYSTSFHCLKNSSSTFQMYMGLGLSWITCLKFEFLVAPLIFRAGWWKAIERFIPLLLVFKALSALMPTFWHLLSCLIFHAEAYFLSNQVFHKALVEK